jgi:WD40 repeat protein
MRRIFLTIYLVTTTFLLHPAFGQDNNMFSQIAYLPHSELITQIEWSPDGSKLASISWDEIQIWDTGSWELLMSISNAYVYAISWHPDSSILAGVRGGYNESLVLWDANTGEIIQEFTRSRPEGAQGILILHDLSWHPASGYILSDSGLSNDIILSWDLTSNGIPRSLITSNSEEDYYNIIELELSPDGQRLLSSGTEEGKSIIRVWDIDSLEPIFDQQGFSPIDWGTTTNEIVAVGLDYSINIWNIETNEVLVKFEDHQNVVNALSWNWDRQLIASVDIDNNLKLWSTLTGVNLYSEHNNEINVQTISWKSDEDQLAVAGAGGIMILQYTTED